MNKIYIDREDTLNASRLKKIISYHRAHIVPELKFNRGYYDGVGQEIMRRELADSTKPNNKIVKNYCKSIVENFRGYITGLPVTYAAKADQDITTLLECLKLNDYENSDSEWLKNALIYGYAPQLCYVNERNEYRFKNINPECVIPVYAADLDEELLYCIYYYPIIDWDSDAWEHNYHVDVYDSEAVAHFTCDSSFGNMIPAGEIEPHYFQEVPFSIFYLTDDMESIFKCVIGLQDAYNKMLSDSVNDWESFVDAYMVFSNTTAEPEDIEKIKENRVLILDDDATVSYLTKNSSDAQVMNLLDKINTSIHTIANSPDFSSEVFGSGVSSGIALQFKLVGFNNIASNIESQFRKAIMKRIHLLNAVFTLLDWEAFDIQINFTHNLPANITEAIDNVNKLRGLVSDETLLAQLPFINDVADEMEKVKAQTDLLGTLYSFGSVEEAGGNANGAEEK